MSFKDLGEQIGKLVESKQVQYGDSISKTESILISLYPDGVSINQYGNFLLIVRVLDKLSRLSHQMDYEHDLGGESPWTDIAGYALLGASKK